MGQYMRFGYCFHIGQQSRLRKTRTFMQPDQRLVNRYVKVLKPSKLPKMIKNQYCYLSLKLSMLVCVLLDRNANDRVSSDVALMPTFPYIYGINPSK